MVDIEPPIFVFGSNERGVHGAGAALFAKKYKGAVYGVGFGHQGHSFAIPTKDWNIDTLPLSSVAFYVERFLAYAQKSEHTFHLTKIGCGLAGHSENEISKLFAFAPNNVLLIDDDGNVVCKASEWMTIL